MAQDMANRDLENQTRSQGLLGSAQAQYDLALRYFNGDRVAQDYMEAFKMCTEATRNKHTDAEFLLGCMYEHGRGTSKDEVKAAVYYKRAADKNHVGTAMIDRHRVVMFRRVSAFLGCLVLDLDFEA
jgi:TPR repeat protein